MVTCGRSKRAGVRTANRPPPPLPAAAAADTPQQFAEQCQIKLATLLRSLRSSVTSKAPTLTGVIYTTSRIHRQDGTQHFGSRQIGNSHFGNTTFWHCDILALRHFATQTFWHFTKNRHFATQTFCHLDFLPHQTFCHQDISPPRHFATLTFCHTRFFDTSKGGGTFFSSIVCSQVRLSELPPPAVA